MSSKILVVAALIALLAGVGIGYVIPREAEPGGLRGEIPIDVLLPLTGDFASYGARGKACVELAEKRNQKLRSKRCLPVTFKFYYEDTETKSDVARQKVQTLAAKGVKVVTDLLCSADIQAIKTYADSNKIVVITPFSTVAELDVAGDYTFRLIPHDDMEGVALAKLVYGLGFRYVAILQRNDPCDISIAQMFKKRNLRSLAARSLHTWSTNRYN